MIALFRDLMQDETAAAAAEYAIILAIVGSGIAGAAFFLGDQIGNALRTVGSDITACTISASPNC